MEPLMVTIMVLLALVGGYLIGKGEKGGEER